MHAVTNCGVGVLQALSDWESVRELQLEGLKLIVILTRRLNDEEYSFEVIQCASVFLNGPLIEFQHKNLLTFKKDTILLMEILKIFDNMSFSTKFITKSSLREMFPLVIEILSLHNQNVPLLLKGLQTVFNIIDPLYITDENVSVSITANHFL